MLPITEQEMENMTCARIRDIICNYFNITLEQLQSKHKQPRLTNARKAICYIANECASDYSRKYVAELLCVKNPAVDYLINSFKKYLSEFDMWAFNIMDIFGLAQEREQDHKRVEKELPVLVSSRKGFVLKEKKHEYAWQELQQNAKAAEQKVADQPERHCYVPAKIGGFGDLLVETLRLRTRYGEPREHMETVAKIWEVILDVKVEPYKVALCMDALKTARLLNDPNNKDSWIDKAGYSAIGAELAGEK